jgi:glutaredoxin-related protein
MIKLYSFKKMSMVINNDNNTIKNEETKIKINPFKNYASITEKKEYMQKRLKLEDSYIIFFAYNDKEENKENTEDLENINSIWADFFNEISQSEIKKHLEIITFNQKSDKKLLELLIEDNNKDKDPLNFEEINYPQIIMAHPHLVDPIYIRNPDTFEIYELISEHFNYYENKFVLEKKNMFEKIEKLLSSFPIIIFIKGSPMNPFCKFSKSFMAIINKLEIKYKSFDIFKDEGLRCWLRLYSGWKTYPQIYINGKVIGGVDRLNELIEKNEFMQMVPFECKKEGVKDFVLKLVEKNNIMVFGKGNINNDIDIDNNNLDKNSQEVYSILKDKNLKFEIFDVMKDEVKLIIFYIKCLIFILSFILDG